MGSATSGAAITYRAISMMGVDNLLIMNNDIFGDPAGNSNYGQAGIYVFSVSSNLKIRRNRIHDFSQSTTNVSPNYGIYYAGDASTANEISNNVIYNIRSFASPMGIAFGTGGNVLVYHNTINMSGNCLSATSTTYATCINVNAAIVSLNIRDNILKNSIQPVSANANTKTYAIYSLAPATAYVNIDYNDYYVDGNNPNIGYLGSARNTLADWKNATGQDASSASLDPMFISPVTLTPSNILLNNTGLYLDLVPVDINNNMRTNPPDMGAYNFGTDPELFTNAATLVTYNSADLNGAVNPNSYTVSVFFDYGLTTAYGNTVTGNPSSVTGTSQTMITYPLSGLPYLTQYHYRIRIVTSTGLIAYGNDRTFTTQAAPPFVTTLAAGFVTSSSAVLNGSVNPNSFNTNVTFDYGTTSTYGTTVNAVPGMVTGTTAVPVSFNLTGLLPNTTYHFRVTGSNSVANVNGSDLTFTTAAIPAVVVTTLPSVIGNTTATITGTVNANNALTNVSFEWGLTTSYGNNIVATPSSATGMSTTSVSANLTGLSWATTYHYRCKGINIAGTANGQDMTFQTSCPAVAAPGAITGLSSVCSGSTGVTYSINPIPSVVNYFWTVPAGATIVSGANTASITVAFPTSAVSGNVSVFGTNQCSNSSTVATLPVTVMALPVPVINGPATVCSQSPSTYTTQPGMTGYVWTVSAGGIITSGAGTNTVTVTWSTPGPGTVSVNYTNASGCSAMTPVVYNVTITALPAPTITGSTSLCVNSGYYSYTTEPNQSNYSWAISAGGSIVSGAGTSSIQVSWSTPGNQTVSVNYTNPNGCTATNPSMLNVTVNDVPSASGMITGTPVVCAGSMGVAYSVAPIAGAVSYVWALPAGATLASGSGSNAITVDFSSNAQSGTVTVSGNNLCGNGPASPSFAVTVTSLPPAAGIISGPAVVCQGSTAGYSVNPIAGASTYNWTIPAGATIISGSGTNSIQVSFGNTAVPDSVTVSGSNSCGNGTSSALSVSVAPIPVTPVVTANGYDLSSSVAIGNQWYRDGTAVPGATGQTYIVPVSEPGWYWTIVTQNECSSDTSNHLLVNGVGIKEHFSGSVNIYPVPNHGKFSLSVNSEREALLNLEVYNSLGVRVYDGKIPFVTKNQVTEIDLGIVPDGLYTLILYDGDNQITRKVVVSK